MSVEIANRQRVLNCLPDDIRRVVELALEREGRRAELSVAIVDEPEMIELNGRYLGRSETTDVLAFPYGEEDGVLSGEIVVNAALAVREAASRGHGPIDELMLYLVHGVLHLCGYDDHEPAESERMWQRQHEILAAAGRDVPS